ncbi:HNH endonuclease domain-containing protein [Christiangramia crocea]|uniref:HNH endonuclease n=1 Tax=Christiangramia crocea TaxID=2904124 RepID=A0A9X1UVS3_9FLAO|nr:HNH endonuclease domain-containing protein [Gramella crocea]MCG9971168.1 HNH endonuclease [Gramella crocea]
MIEFQVNDPTLESQWRALILFGKNSATYKFAFAKSLLEIADKETTTVSLIDLAEPFSRHITEHLKINDKQGSSNSSNFLNACRSFNDGKLKKDALITITEKLGFVNVVDAFQNINGGKIPNLFYEKDFKNGNKNIVVRDELLKLKESYHFQNFDSEVEARWKLVETAWNLEINPNILEVQYDDDLDFLFLENNIMRRKSITSARNALNGYQKGKCFYSNNNISLQSGNIDLCHVDHFLPHVNKLQHIKHSANINGVWNLVLAHPTINSIGEKGTKIPTVEYLQKLYKRNEYYIDSKHPLGETIVNQTGKTKESRRRFLQKQYDVALENSILTWSPKDKLDNSI